MLSNMTKYAVISLNIYLANIQYFQRAKLHKKIQ